MSVYFNQIERKRKGRVAFQPRAVMVDSEPETLNQFRQENKRKYWFNHDNFVIGTSGCGNNWAKGYYTEGAKIVNDVLDSIRRESEKCHNLQAFDLIHSLGGATGSGLGSLVTSKLTDLYKNKNNKTVLMYFQAQK